MPGRNDRALFLQAKIAIFTIDMIHRKSLFCLFLALLVISCTKPAQEGGGTETGDIKVESSLQGFNNGENLTEEPDDPSADPSSAYGFNYSLLSTMGHPRLMMTADDFAGLKKLVENGKSDDLICKMHSSVMAYAQRQVLTTDAILYEFPDDKSMLTYCRTALRRLFACCYAYRMTGEQKYLNKARTDLTTILRFPDWNPRHYLDVGEMSLAVAIGYDWLYEYLTVEEKTALHKALTANALVTSRTTDIYSSTSNGNQVCICGVTAAAIAVYEKDKAISAEAIERGIPSNKRALEYLYSPDGNTNEGYEYWDYGTSFETVYLQMLQTAFGHCAGLDQVPGVDKTGQFITYLSGLVRPFSYADGGSGGRTLSPAQWWICCNYNMPEHLVLEQLYYKQGTYDRTTHRLFPSIPCFIYKHPISVGELSFPKEKLWVGGGNCPVAMIRDGWKFDANDRFVGLKGGCGSLGHGHMDAGSFVYDARSLRWSDDISVGSYTTYQKAMGSNNWRDYSQTGLRWDIMRTNNILHSTICFYNQDDYIGTVKRHITDQVATFSGLDAGIVEKGETANESFARMKLTEAYKGQVASAYRTIKMDSDNLYIIDEISAKPSVAAEMEWRMLTVASVDVGTSYETLSQEGETLYLSVESDSQEAKPVLKKWTTERPSSWATTGWDISAETIATKYTVAGYSVTVPAGKTATFTTKLSFAKP